MDCKCTLAQRLAGDGCEVCNPTLALEYAKEIIAELQAENEKLRELLSGKAYLDTNARLGAEITVLKAELAEAKKDAELWREREAKIKSLRERGFLGSPLRGEPYKIYMKGK